jgi:hypothetical protein
MEVHFSRELEEKINRASATVKGGADQYVQELVEHYVDHDLWFRDKVTNSIDQLERGESLSHEEVGAMLKRLFQRK